MIVTYHVFLFIISVYVISSYFFIYIVIDPYHVDGMAIHRPIMRRSLQAHLDLVRSANQIDSIGVVSPCFAYSNLQVLYCTPSRKVSSHPPKLRSRSGLTT